MTLHRPKDVARILGLSVDHVRRLMRTGKVPAVRIGGRRYVTQEQLDELLASAPLTLPFPRAGPEQDRAP